MAPQAWHEESALPWLLGVARRVALHRACSVGRLVRQDTVTWVEPGGQRWSVTSSGLSRADLVPLVDGLRLGPQVLLSGAPAAGFTPLQLPEQQSPDEGSFVPTWDATYRQGPARQVDVAVSRSAGPWQTKIARSGSSGVSSTLVEVGGRPAVLVVEPGLDLSMVFWEPEPGVQIMIRGSLGSPSEALAFAASLEQVAADDPRIVPMPTPS